MVLQSSEPRLERVSGPPSELLATWESQGWPSGPGLRLVEFQLESPWQGENEVTILTGVYLVSTAGIEGFLVTDRPISDIPLEDGGPHVAFSRLQSTLSAVACMPGQPLKLEPLSVPKPWGQEIWYTGIEERGVCRFVDGASSTPIPWLQAAAPRGWLGEGAPPVLLKILDPSPEPVIGDLYFELHDEKREVYVVTHVDRGAWPDGIGAIRYGFDRERVAAASDEDEFRREYLEAVRRYEAVRRDIDNAEHTPSPDLLEQEKMLRAEMDAYTALRPLGVGDVVRVPLLLPHSLQHGVRTVEFQTPVYERQILAFAQKVLTQDHWDTEEAVSRMTLLAPEDEPLETVLDQPGVTVERIVDFDDFEVFRARLSGKVSWTPDLGGSYALMMVIEGRGRVSGRVLSAEEAVLLPGGFASGIAPEGATKECVFLLALPRR